MPRNGGTGAGTTIKDLAERMHAVCGESRKAAGQTEPVLPLRHGPPRAGDLQSNLVDYRKAQSTLDWKPATDLEAGLRETVEWFAEADA